MSAKPKLMTHEEYEAVRVVDGPTAASYSAFDRIIKVWRYENPDDERNDYEIAESTEFEKWNRTTSV